MIPYLDIIIFAALAIFVILRLKSTLGTRNGSERQRPNPYTIPAPEPRAQQPIDILPSRGQILDQIVVDDGQNPALPVSVAGGLTQIKMADPTFDEKTFLEGARAAFTMIVDAFSKGDEHTLSGLLSPEAMKNFRTAMNARREKGETLETQILRIKETDIIAARVNADLHAFITVTFISDQINVTRDAQNNIIDGTADRGEEITDRWIFRRDTRSPDPNWVLTATGVPA